MATKALITHSELLEAMDYNPETGIFRWKHRSDCSKRWNSRYAGKIAGGIGPQGYMIIGFNGEKYRAHRLAWLYMTGEWPSEHIDHKKGNRLDNRFAKLREATNAQNIRNSTKKRTNTSGIKGVYWNRKCKKWQAQIVMNYVHHYLGVFTNIEDAEKAYREAADSLHGEFARHG
jgi:HNH endonuclease/AP2 domain